MGLRVRHRYHDCNRDSELRESGGQSGAHLHATPGRVAAAWIVGQKAFFPCPRAIRQNTTQKTVAVPHSMKKSSISTTNSSYRTLLLTFGALCSFCSGHCQTPPLGLQMELVPKLTVVGPVGSQARVESARSLSGPWTTWTNVAVSAEGTVLVDLSPGSATHFYRAVADPVGFVWIPPGTFVMGSPTNEPGRASFFSGGSSEEQHTVTLTRGFWLSDHEVTQSEFQSVMGKAPSNFKGAPDRPVETVSWGDAMAYCQELTARERTAGRITVQQTYRLPTEAEWEYAARAGSPAARYGALDSVAWFLENSGNQTHPVRQLPPNAWGLYDMYGNVSELCLDYVPIGFGYPTGMTDPIGCCGDQYDPMIVRGGSWQSSGNEARFIQLRAAARESVFQDSRGSPQIGFRPVLSAVR